MKSILAVVVFSLIASSAYADGSRTNKAVSDVVAPNVPSTSSVADKQVGMIVFDDSTGEFKGLDSSGNWDSMTGGVTSFNTRTGAVTLNSSDVDTALGLSANGFVYTNGTGSLAALTCSSGEGPQWSGSAWTCASSGGGANTSLSNLASPTALTETLTWATLPATAGLTVPDLTTYAGGNTDTDIVIQGGNNHGNPTYGSAIRLYSGYNDYSTPTAGGASLVLLGGRQSSLPSGDANLTAGSSTGTVAAGGGFAGNINLTAGSTDVSAENAGSIVLLPGTNSANSAKNGTVNASGFPVTNVSLLQINPQASGTTPTCGSSQNGYLAFTSAYVLCVCNTSGWVKAADGSTACTF